jgi:hypothetical protein
MPQVVTVEKSKVGTACLCQRPIFRNRLTHIRLRQNVQALIELRTELLS